MIHPHKKGIISRCCFVNIPFRIVGQRRQDSRVHENGSVSSSLLPGLAELLATTQALREGSLTSADKRLMVALAQKVLTEEMGEAAPEEEEEEEEEGLTGFLVRAKPPSF